MRSLLVLSPLALAAPAAAQFPAYSLDGANPGDFFGDSVAVAGDIDNDGFGDFVIGAPNADVMTTNGGQVTVVSGPTGAVLYQIAGADGSGRLGDTVAGGGDVNNDGRADFAAGAPWFLGIGPIQGKVIVYSGLDGSVLHTWEGPNSFALFGEQIDISADVNGDGHDDALIGAPNDDGNTNDSGIVYVYSGLDGTLLYQVSGDNSLDQLGFSLDACGDVDGDLLDDWIAGAPFADLNGSNSGQVKVVSGATGAVIHSLVGNAAEDAFGRSVAGVGDVNADGLADFAVGAWKDATGGADAGSVTVYSGADASVLTQLVGAPGEQLGFALSLLGDYDGDGVDDLGVGSKAGTPGGSIGIFSTQTWLELGRVFGSTASAIDTGFAGGSDINGDGTDELVVGFRQAGGNNTGEAVVYSVVNLLGTPYCFGDGSASPCPCGNSGAAGAGCGNSTGLGAALTVSGSISASNDDLVMTCVDLLPNQPALLFAGLNATNGGAGLPFGDGLRCAGGSVLRLGVEQPDGAGAASWGPGLVALGGFGAGDLRRFQTWYRDPAGSPCGTGFNLSNGFEIQFLP